MTLTSTEEWCRAMSGSGMHPRRFHERMAERRGKVYSSGPVRQAVQSSPARARTRRGAAVPTRMEGAARLEWTGRQPPTAGASRAAAKLGRAASEHEEKTRVAAGEGASGGGDPALRPGRRRPPTPPPRFGDGAARARRARLSASALGWACARTHAPRAEGLWHKSMAPEAQGEAPRGKPSRCTREPNSCAPRSDGQNSKRGAQAAEAEGRQTDDKPRPGRERGGRGVRDSASTRNPRLCDV